MIKTDTHLLIKTKTQKDTDPILNMSILITQITQISHNTTLTRDQTNIRVMNRDQISTKVINQITIRDQTSTRAMI